MTPAEVSRVKRHQRYLEDAEYRERVKTYARRYYEEHREQIKEYMRKWHESHKPTKEEVAKICAIQREKYKHRLMTDPMYARAEKRKRMLRSQKYAERCRLRYATDPEYRAKKQQYSREYQRKNRERMKNGERSTETGEQSVEKAQS